MSAPEPMTEVESEALHELGHFWLDSAGNLLGVIEVDAAILQAYRAGFAAARTPPELRVFRAGDPEPGPEVTAVVDADGDMWQRYDTQWGLSGAGRTPWTQLVESYGPLVAGIPRPLDAYDAAVDAAALSRAAAESAGGAQ